MPETSKDDRDSARRMYSIEERISALLDRMEARLDDSLAKEAYSTDEAAKLLKRAPWTIRQWCNEGRARAKKIRGRGRRGEWRIPHEELQRLQREGPLGRAC
jgi:excisionase family DNA binding protein